MQADEVATAFDILLRNIYFGWDAGEQFWLFTLYDKDEMADLTAQQRRALRGMITAELDARGET